MLCVDESRNAAGLLAFGNGMDGEGSLTTALRTVDFDYSSFRITAYAKGCIQGDTSRRYNLHVLYLLVAKLHYRPLSEVFLYLCHGSLQGFQLALLCCRHIFVCLCHFLIYIYSIAYLRHANIVIKFLSTQKVVIKMWHSTKSHRQQTFPLTPKWGIRSFGGYFISTALPIQPFGIWICTRLQMVAAISVM